MFDINMFLYIILGLWLMFLTPMLFFNGELTIREIMDLLVSKFYSEETMKYRLEEIFSYIHKTNMDGRLIKRMEFRNDKGYYVCRIGRYKLFWGQKEDGRWMYYIQYKFHLVYDKYVSAIVIDDEVIIKRPSDYSHVRNFLKTYKMLVEK